MIDYLSVIADESAKFSDAVRSGDMGAQVPSCPDWKLADLAWHLAEVQHFWGSIADGLLLDPDDVVTPDRPGDDELPSFFDDRSAFMLRTLTERDPGDRCWSWNEEGWSIGWLRRRQAHEALIHRVDAEQTAGVVSEVDAELASDGVGEMLTSQIDGPIPEWGRVDLEETHAVLASADTGARWGLQFGRFRGTSPNTGNTYDLDTLTVTDPVDEPSLTVEGSAVGLDLWLWGRTGQEALTVTGDRELLARLRAIATEATQ